MNQFSRTELLLGGEAVEALANSRVAVFGVGGVGGYVCEALARSGIGALDLVDDDAVSLTNLNRQIIALHSTLGRPKAEVMRERILDINPAAKVTVYRTFFLPENADEFPFDKFDYIVDAVDTVTAKLELICRAKQFAVPVISAMGAGNKLRADMMRVADIYATKVCPLARIMRRELRKRGIDKLKVVYSEEPPISPSAPPQGSEQEQTAVTSTRPESSARRALPGSVPFVPAAAGLIIAGEVVCDLAAPYLSPRR